jgi:hypothetical protein
MGPSTTNEQKLKKIRSVLRVVGGRIVRDAAT